MMRHGRPTEHSKKVHAVPDGQLRPGGNHDRSLCGQIPIQMFSDGRQLDNQWFFTDERVDCQTCVNMLNSHQELIEFRVTFGTAHIREWPQDPEAHPDGWWAVFAHDEMWARAHVFSIVGPRWSFIYHPSDEGYPSTERYPRGEVVRLTEGYAK